MASALVSFATILAAASDVTSDSARADGRARERALLIRVRDGDADAFRAVVEQHIDRVTRLAVYLIGAPDVAEDVTQYVFVQVWEHRRTLDPDRPLRPYLLRAVHNRAANERKADAVRARYRQTVHAEALAGAIRTTVPSPEGSVLTSALVQQALDRLQERRQLALRLWFEQELTPPEIAEVLGISPQAADRLMRRALADLRDILAAS